MSEPREPIIPQVPRRDPLKMPAPPLAPGQIAVHLGSRRYVLDIQRGIDTLLAEERAKAATPPAESPRPVLVVSPPEP